MRSVLAGSLLISGCIFSDKSPGWQPADQRLDVVSGCGRVEELAPTSARIAGPDQLEVVVQHGGGCGRHAYRACWDGTFLESAPVQARLIIQHDDLDRDMCDAFLTVPLTVELDALREAYQGMYGSSGTVILRLGGASPRYEF